ncbi:MAG TPA: 3-hydroxyacyl-CoA dehydrogenase NAD-binding domain-containing protein [Dongiaceae bacterium]|nr:3-hydroxyacyl-CoA dehydrogenase NAD-binding domain-containing protein [Dongiaceae bacterium]
MTEARITFGIIGCGLIGASWAALAASAGYPVHAWDPEETARKNFLARVAAAQVQLSALGMTGKADVILADTLQDVARDCRWIQENAPERLELKAALLAEVEFASSPETIIASSTSSLLWSELARNLRRPSHFLLAHPFNPPHLMPLVEIYASEASIRDRAVDFYTRLGRVPVCLKREAQGHIANRLASALWREAVNIVAEGIADVADVDRALVNGPGLRWSVIGAHMAYHLGGGPGGIAHYLQHLGPSQERRWADLGTPKLTPEVCKLLTDGIAAEAAGRSIAELEQDRDAALIASLQLRNRMPAS